MRRGIILAIAILYSVLLIPAIPTQAQTTETNIWNGSLSAAELQDISENRVFNSPFCSYEPALLRTLHDPLGILTPAEFLTASTYDNLGEICVLRNSQGQFAEHENSLIYGYQGSPGLIKLLPRAGTGVFEYIPAPGGQYVLSMFRSAPQNNSGVLAYHPNWFENISYQRQGIQQYIKHTTSGFSLRYGNGQSYYVTRDALAYSQNGRYVVVSRGPYIDKIDLQELTQTPLTYVTSPESTRLAISNDGRYVAYGKNTYLNVIDTQECQQTYEYGSWVDTRQQSYDGCLISDNVGQILYDQGLLDPAQAYSLFRPYFSPAGNSLYAAVGRTEAGVNGLQWREYKVTAEDYVSSAQGYLAIGDSFVSGEGDLQGDTWYEPGTDEQGDKSNFAGRNLCHLSRRSYPYLMAVELGYLSATGVSPASDGLFHSVACSGAKIHNIIGGPFGLVENDAPETAFGRADNQYRIIESGDNLQGEQPGYRKQLSYLDFEEFDVFTRSEKNPEIITIGIGGNDADFGGYLASCLLPFTCNEALQDSEENDWLGLRIATLKVRLTRVFETIKRESPESRIYVHGYPQFINSNDPGVDSTTNPVCDPNVRLDQRERVVATQGVVYMNQVIKAAAQEAGVFYVDVEDVLNGGRLCDEVDDNKDLFFNGITAGNDIISAGFCALRSGCVGSESYHPRSSGHQKYSEAILSQTNNLTAPMPEPQKTATPEPPAEVFGQLTRSYVQNYNNSQLQQITVPEPRTVVATNPSSSDKIVIARNNLIPGSTVRVEIRSEPTELGIVIVPESGEVYLEVEIPSELEPGAHTVYLYGVDRNGDEFIEYEPIMLAQSSDDFDGDGVLDGVDSCPVVENANTDIDEDGIDDACDDETETPEPEDEPEPDPEPESEPEKKTLRQRLRSFFNRVINWFISNWLNSSPSFSRGWRR